MSSLVFVLGLGVCAQATADEVLPPTQLPCFPGAYYRKAVSSFDRWAGVEGVITLPTPILDQTRQKEDGRHLDNPSIYLGGRAGTQEIDAGLTWSRVRLPDGSLSRTGQAFRIFWRNDRWHTGPIDPEFCYYPGDKVLLRCVATAPGKLRLDVELLRRGTNCPTAAAPKAPTASKYSVTMDARAFGPQQIQQFKRVNAIDQVGREGKKVERSQAKVLDTVWHEFWLIRGKTKVPMNSSRYTDMRCPAPDHVEVSNANDNGGERISLFATPEP